MLPVLAVLASALCFATTGTAQALADVDASPLAVGAARIVIGGGLLALLALRHRAAAPSPVPRRSMPGLVAVGVVGVLAYQPLFFLGTHRNGVAVGTVVALGTAPLVTGALDALVGRRLPSARWAAATVVAVAGVVLVSGMIENAPTLDAIGVSASAGAGAAYALYAVSGKALMDHRWHPTRVMGTLFGVAALVGIPVLLLAGAGWILTPAGFALAAWLGVVTTAVGYVLFGWGLARTGAVTASTLTLAEPVAATVLGLTVLHETLSAAAALGIALIVVGVALVSSGTRERGSQRAPVPA